MRLMNSMPQQLVAKGSGHRLFLRAMPMAWSTLVAKKPVPMWPGGGSTMVGFSRLGACSGWSFLLFMVWCGGRRLFPFQCPLLDHVHEACEHKAQEHQHLHKAEHAQFLEVHRPGVEEDDLHVEEHEKYGDQEVLHRERCPGIAVLLDAALKALFLLLAAALGSQPGGRAQGYADKAGGDDHLDDHREIVVGGAHASLEFRANLRLGHGWCKGNRPRRGQDGLGRSLLPSYYRSYTITRRSSIRQRPPCSFQQYTL